MIQSKKRDFGILFLTMCLNLTGFAIILPLSPSMMEYYLPQAEHTNNLLGSFISLAGLISSNLGHENPQHLTAVFFGCLLASLYAFLQFIFAPIWGRMSDKYGRRPILLSTLAVTSIAYFIWIFASSFNLLILSRILGGITAANISVVSASIADLTDRHNRARGMALIGMAFGLGFLMGPTIGGLCSSINLTILFPSLSAWHLTPFSFCSFVAFLFALLNFLWVYFKYTETLPISKAQCPKTFHADLKPNNPIRKTNLSYFIFILAFSGLEFTLAFLAHERFAYSPIMLGYLFLYIGVILILTQGLITKKIAIILSEKHLAISGILSGIISYIILAFATTQLLFYIGASFLAISVGLTTPSLSSLTSLYASEDTQGKFQGKFRSSGSLARAFGPIATASLYFYYGPEITYLTAPFILILPVFLILSLPRPQKA